MYELEPGSSLGKYQIIRKLADGGMAEIYLARLGGTAGFEKVVALKRIRPYVADDRAQLHMFLDEARLSATLRHANIAEVIDIGSQGDTYFFAMEYVDGQDVRNLLFEANEARQPIPLEVSLAIACGTASALAYAHAKTGPGGPLGLVHRDVSPANILVSYDGAVKLVDFGIARATSRTTKTLTGVLKGKVPYMSPEQCRGKVLDRRSDLFSLGIVLYELTTGQRPFGGRSEYDMLENIAIGSAVRPSTIVSGYPGALEMIVVKALERDLTRRYQTAEALLADLERLIASLGMFISALSVGKYLRALFANELAEAQAKAIELPDPASWNEPMLDYRMPDDDTTAGFQRKADGTVVPMLAVSAATRAPVAKRAGTQTQAEIDAPVDGPADALDEFSAEMYGELDQDAPTNEPVDARTRRRIDTLVDRAFACYGVGELDKAVTAVELAMSEDGDSAVAQQLVHGHRETIKAIFQAFLGSAGQVPELAAGTKEVDTRVQHSLLVSRIDGHANIEELVHTSGLSPLETYRQLALLVLRGVVVLAPPG